MSRRRRATPTSSRISRSGAARPSRARRSSASLSRSIGSCSAMFAPYPRPQALQGTKLQLLDRSFTAPQSLRDFAGALLFHETQFQDPALVFGQVPHQREDRCAVVRELLIGLLDFRRWLDRAFPSYPLRTVRDLVRRDAIK